VGGDQSAHAGGRADESSSAPDESLPTYLTACRRRARSPQAAPRTGGDGTARTLGGQRESCARQTRPIPGTVRSSCSWRRQSGCPESCRAKSDRWRRCAAHASADAPLMPAPMRRSCQRRCSLIPLRMAAGTCGRRFIGPSHLVQLAPMSHGRGERSRCAIDRQSLRQLRAPIRSYSRRVRDGRGFT